MNIKIIFDICFAVDEDLGLIEKKKAILINREASGWGDKSGKYLSHKQEEINNEIVALKVQVYDHYQQLKYSGIILALTYKLGCSCFDHFKEI